MKCIWGARKRMASRIMHETPGNHVKMIRRTKVTCARSLCSAIAETLYDNLENLYNFNNYPSSYIWNYDESGVQACRSGDAIVVARRRRRSVHSIEPHQREHLSILSCVNVDGGHIPNFYILKGIYFCEDYLLTMRQGP